MSNGRIQVPGAGAVDMEAVLRQQQMAQAAVNNTMIQTGVQIYSKLVSDAIQDGESLGVEDYRRMAFKAKEAAPFILEAFGMIKVEVKEESKDGE